MMCNQETTIMKLYNKSKRELLFLTVMFLLVGQTMSYAQDYQTVKSGAWTEDSTWEGGTAPPNPVPNGSSVTIMANHQIWIFEQDIEIVNDGFVVCNGNMTIGGSTDIQNAVFTNNGTVTVTSLFRPRVYGTLINNGTINFDGDTFGFDGTIINNSLVNQNSRINMSSTDIAQRARLENYGDWLGTSQNLSIFDGIVINGVGATILSGTLSGGFDIEEVDITNSGTMNVDDWQCNSNITNTATGVINAPSTFSHSTFDLGGFAATHINEGEINVNDYILAGLGSSLDNSKGIINMATFRGAGCNVIPGSGFNDDNATIEVFNFVEDQTMYIDEDFVLDANMNFQFYDDGGPKAPKMVVNGDLTIDPTSSFVNIFLSGLTLAVGSEYDLITSTGTITGTFGNTPNFNIIDCDTRIELIYEPNRVYVKVTDESPIILDFTSSTGEFELSCNNSSYLLTVVPQNGVSYEWQNGETSFETVVNSPGTYTVTATGIGCMTEESIEVIAIAPPQIDITNLTTFDLECDKPSILIDASATTGIAPLSFLWSNGATTQSIDVTAPGIYSLVVTDGDGCSSLSLEYEILQDNTGLPSVMLSASESSIDCGQPVTLDASGSSGAGMLTYLWSTMATTEMIEVNTAGNYAVTITDMDNGCQSAASIILKDSGPSVTAIISLPTATELGCDVSSIELNTTGSMGPNLTYLWSNQMTTPSITVTKADTYIVTVTSDGSSCTDVASIMITQEPTATNAIISNTDLQIDCTTPTITLDASTSTGSNKTYVWSNGPMTATNPVTTPGAYMLTVTDLDNAGCTSIVSVMVTRMLSDPMAMIMNASGNTEINCAVSSIELLASGTGSNLTYLWSDPLMTTTPALTVTSGGTYTVTVTDPATGCTSMASVMITQDPTVPEANITLPIQPDLNCNTTSVVLDASASTGTGLSYAWSTMATTPMIPVSAAGMYSVTITETGTNCTATASVTIKQDAAVVANIAMPTTTVLNCETTTIALNAGTSTGEGTLSYQWDDMAMSTSSSIMVTTPDTYAVTVTDGDNMCTAVSSMVITQNITMPTVNITSALGTEINCTSPMLTLQANASPNVSYQWSDPMMNSTSSLSVNQANTYTVTVTETTSKCTAMASIMITADPSLPIAMIATPTTTQLDCDVQMITLDASMSSGMNLSYLWNNIAKSTTPSINVDVADSYTVSVTNTVSGCVDTETIMITHDEMATLAKINVPQGAALNCALDMLTLDASMSTVTGPATYAWSNTTMSTTPTIMVGSAGTYTVTVTNTTNGCSDMAQIMTTEDFVVPKVGITGATVYCDQTMLGLMENGGEAASWSWSGPDMFSSTMQTAAETVDLMSAGNYTVTVTGTNGCTNMASTMVTINPLPVIDVESSIPVCDEEDLDLMESGGNATEWLWTLPDMSTRTTQGFTIANADIPEGTYTLVITDVNGCKLENSFPVQLFTSETFSTNFLVGGTACVGQPIKFFDWSGIPDATLAISTFKWDFGNGDTSSERDPFYTYTSVNGAVEVFNVGVEINTQDNVCPNISLTKPLVIRSEESCRLSQQSGDKNLSIVYPTLSSGELRYVVDLFSPSRVVMSISDMQGNLLETQYFEENSTLDGRLKIDQEGMYLVQFHHKEGVLTNKVIVMH